MEVPALEPYAFAVLCEDVAKWPSSPARDKWLSILQPIAKLPKKFAAEDSIAVRIEIMDEANRRLAELGGSRESTRFLYAATNPIGEECMRECNFEIGQNLIDEVATEAAPWVDLWRDNYAFVAHRIATGLRGILEKMNTDTVRLPSFLRACEGANLPNRRGYGCLGTHGLSRSQSSVSEAHGSAPGQRRARAYGRRLPVR